MTIQSALSRLSKWKMWMQNNRVCLIFQGNLNDWFARVDAKVKILLE